MKWWILNINCAILELKLKNWNINVKDVNINEEFSTKHRNGVVLVFNTAKHIFKFRPQRPFIARTARCPTRAGPRAQDKLSPDSLYWHDCTQFKQLCCTRCGSFCGRLVHLSAIIAKWVVLTCTRHSALDLALLTWSSNSTCLNGDFLLEMAI